MKKNKTRFRKTGGVIGLPAFERLIHVVKKKENILALQIAPN